MKKIKNKKFSFWNIYYLAAFVAMFFLVITPFVYAFRIESLYSIEKYIFYSLTMCVTFAIILQLIEHKKNK